MYYVKEQLCEENKKNLGIVSVVDMRHFVMLLLADLASKSPIIHLRNRNIKTACLSFEYRRIIEKIMYQENSWGAKFAELIDISSYYQYQSDYEEKLANMINKICAELNKECYFDLESETIRIDFTEEEIENIKGMYDEHILKTMDHFSSLMADRSFTRTFEMNSKEMKRSEAIFRHNMEELTLRTSYSNRFEIAKPLYEEEPVLEENDNKSLVKKLGNLFKRSSK